MEKYKILLIIKSKQERVYIFKETESNVDILTKKKDILKNLYLPK